VNEATAFPVWASETPELGSALWREVEVLRADNALRKEVGDLRRQLDKNSSEPPVYKKRAPAPSLIDRFEPYLRERLEAYPSPMV
jgi:hypothetical protein